MKKTGLLLLFAAAIISSCKKETPEETPTPPTTNIEAQKIEVVKTYSKIVHASYEDSYNAVLTLKDKIYAFVDNPTQEAFDACKQAWLDSRIPYGQTEAYRFYDGPIDNEDGPEGLINAWPLDEGYIDYIVSDANSGIINDVAGFPVINTQVLEDANEEGGETNVATGYHAIEFLLWGQDLSETGPGERPYTDYLVGGTASNQVRRGQYLKAAVDLLEEHLAFLVAEWAEGGTYRNEFENDLSNIDALTNIIRGIGELSKGELAGERMTVALTNNDQEDEHSCFSDNTHIDIAMNYKGIENVYKGKYTRTNGTVISGKGLSDIIGQADAGKNATILAQFADATAKVGVVEANSPFDQLISDSNPSGNAMVNSAINSLRDLADKIADGALALGITISF